jgi:hypothetical protein
VGNRLESPITEKRFDEHVPRGVSGMGGIEIVKSGGVSRKLMVSGKPSGGAAPAPGERPAISIVSPSRERSVCDSWSVLGLELNEEAWKLVLFLPVQLFE